MTKVRFIGGPLDGGRIRLEKRYTAYYVPLPTLPFAGVLDSDPGDTVVTLLMCYVYQRRGNCLIYEGEKLR